MTNGNFGTQVVANEMYAQAFVAFDVGRVVVTSSLDLELLLLDLEPPLLDLEPLLLDLEPLSRPCRVVNGTSDSPAAEDDRAFAFAELLFFWD